jgi:hypothetical protein
MNVQLDADVEAAILALAAKQGGRAPAEVVNRTLRLALDPPELHRRHDELRRLIQEGIDSGEREGWLDADEVFDEVLRDLQDKAVRSE